MEAPADFVEQSSDDIWAACCYATRQALKLAGIKGDAVAGIGFDATRSLVALDPEVLALERGPRGVQVNAVSPTVVLTEMGREAWAGVPGDAMKQEIPLRRFAMPEEVAAAAVFLASDGADMITGANLIVDGGYTIH